MEDRYGHSTSKIPPYWEPAYELKGYPFRTWLQDLSIWAAGTELNQELQAPAVAQRLGGTAKDLVREVPAEALRDGRVDPDIGLHQTGLQMLIAGLERRHGQFAVEVSTQAIIRLLNFRRGLASVDEALSRFEAIRVQVRQQAFGFDQPAPVTAWLLLEAMAVPRRIWPLCLAPTAGQLLADEVGFRNLTVAIRHQGNISEHPHAGNRSWRDQQGFLADSEGVLGGDSSHTVTYLGGQEDHS